MSNYLTKFDFDWPDISLVIVKLYDMKKIPFILAFIVSCSSLNAQTKKEPNYFYSRRFHFGVKGGININKIEGQGFSNKFSYNFLAGAFVQIKLNKTLQIQPEVNFVQSVVDTTAYLSDAIDYIQFSETNKEIRFSYLSIPILLNIGIGDAKAVKFQVGPQFSVLINKTASFIENGKNVFKSGDFAMVGGIWIQLPLINLNARYVLGLNNLSDATNSTKWKSQSIQVGLGLTF